MPQGIRIKKGVSTFAFLLLASIARGQAGPHPQGATLTIKLAPGTKLTPFEEMIVSKEKEVLELSSRGDYAGWANLLSEDVLAVYDTGYANRAEVLKAIESMSDIHCSMDKVKVIPIGETGALIVYRMTQDWKERGKQMARQYYVSSLWALRGGRWLSSFWQETDTAPSGSELPSSTPSLPSSSFFVAKEKEVWEAFKNKNKDALARLLADDFVGSGYETKAEHVKQIDDHYTIDDYQIQEAKLIPLNSAMALLLYKATCKAKGEWAGYCSQPEYVSVLWVQRNDRWVVLFSQSTPAANTTLPTASSESDDATVLAAIVASEKQIMASLERNDIEAFGNLLPDDVIDVDDEGIHTKAEWLRGFEEQKKAGLLFKAFQMEGLRLVRYGPDAASLVFKETIHLEDKGKPVEWVFHSQSLYVRRNDKWVPRLYQDTTAK